MNQVALMGRLTKNPIISYTQGQTSTKVARYTLAVDRMKAGPNGQREADFISCVAFNNVADFTEKYLHQGSKIAITGRIQTGSYTNREGQKVYTTEVVVNSQEFAESRQQAPQQAPQAQPNNYQPAPQQPAYRPQEASQAPQYQPQEEYQQMGFMDVIPDSPDAEGLPWN